MFSSKKVINNKAVEFLQVMIADTDFHLSRLYSSQLQAFGITNITIDHDPKKALEHLKSHKYDVVIADWGMEPIGGREFARAMRTSEENPSAGAILVGMCSRPKENIFFEMLNAGVDAIVVKPVSANTIMKHIQLNLEHPRVFVRTSDYYGPDRRRGIKVRYEGSDRREVEAVLEARPK
ncbi:response regulator [Kordiimonas sediminis]|uniref:Response regulator n=1 Tax=Kordiimonas sediminis TaxID=1735581 RepID=A0A919AXQ6_9PROT|nr:response regulator [Kordiimonas sediminis]GHF30664.1 response regulator [Kordiimonas sediminis]